MVPVRVSRGLFAWLLALLTLIPVGAAPLSQPSAYRADATLTPPAPYVGQAVVYTVRLYGANLPVVDYQPPDFSGWWRGEAFRSTDVDLLDGQQVQVLTIETLLYPLQAGTLAIDPARLIVPETVFAARIELTTPPLMIAVLPLPDGAPPGFSGAVGQYEVEAAVEPAAVTLGEPLTLRYRVSGSGNLAQIAPPSLHLPDRWRVYPDPTTTLNQARGLGERIFAWRLIAETAGSQVLDLPPFGYFDPIQGSYRTLELPVIPVDVLPAPDGSRELPTFSRTSATTRTALDLKAPGDLSRGSLFSPLLWLLPPLLIGAVWGGIRTQQQWQQQRIVRRQTNALATAVRRLDAARGLTGEAAFRSIEAAIQGYFADRLNAVEPVSLPDLVQDNPVAAGWLQPVLDCRQRAQDGRYAPAGTVNPVTLIEHSTAALRELDRGWQPNRTGTA